MLQISAALFATNAAHALSRRHLFYAVLLLCLCAISIMWHSCDKRTELETPRLLFWLDQFAIWSVGTLTIYYAIHLRGFYRWIFIPLALALIGLGIYLSHEWWNGKESPECHTAIHILSALAVHCVLLGQE